MESIVKSLIVAMTVDEQKNLLSWLESVIAQGEQTAVEIPVKPGREVVERRQLGKLTYQLELIRCGKKNCQCSARSGSKHGPYWYGYRWNGRRVVSWYIGKELKVEDDCDS